MKLVNARLIDGTGAAPIENVTLVFDEKIRAILPSAGLDEYPEGETLDAGGRTVMPGLINVHMHLGLDASAADSFASLRDDPPSVTAIRAAARARRMLEAGITTAQDLGGIDYLEFGVRRLISQGEIPGPHLLCSGKPITITGGTAWPIGRECDGADEVRKGVREQLKAGADVIKLMATGGVLTAGAEPGAAQMTEEELRAGVIEAHKAGRRVATHAQGLAGIKNAIRAGVDTVEHGIFLDDEAIEMMKQQGVIFVPTLAAPYRIMQAGLGGGIPPFVMKKMETADAAHKRSFQRAWQAGVTIAAGNDGGTPFNPHEDLATELRLMVELGMPAMDAIRAGTWGSARALALDEEIGTIEPGKWADLLLLDGDPLTDITALSSVWGVLQRGRLVHGWQNR